jgi:hypothetical protein
MFVLKLTSLDSTDYFSISIVLSLLDGTGLSKEDLFLGATLWRPLMNDFSKDKAENKLLT